MLVQTNTETNNIVHKLRNDIRDDLIITGGHFLINGTKPKDLNTGTIYSFKLAILLYKSARSLFKNIKLGILLNDIGQVCTISQCDISPSINTFSRDTFTLPKEYQIFLNQEKIKKNELHIFWEKHIRNRGKKLFNKIKFKREDITFNNEEYYIDDRDKFGQILLLRRNSRDKYGTPACPLIMASYALEQEKLGIKESLNLYYISNDNNTNIPNHIVIEKGKRVAELVGAKIHVKNVYLTQDGVFKNY